MAEYQYPSDGIPGMPPYSGVIRRSDGRWVPCEYANEDWEAYCEWAKAGTYPDPFKSAVDGGVVIKLQEGEVPVGVMFDSMMPEQPPAAPAPPAAAPPAAAPTPPPTRRDK